MAWIDRLLVYAPDMTDMAGGMLMLGASAGMAAGMMLANPLLCLGAILAWLAGWMGPVLSAMKRERIPGKPNRSPWQEATEDAAVAALERSMEAHARFEEMDWPSGGRLH